MRTWQTQGCVWRKGENEEDEKESRRESETFRS